MYLIKDNNAIISFAMKITGIICEYNPFHNGHKYQIEKVKKDGSDYVISLMSGDWVQRGGPAIIDKHSRTLMALKSGADMVIELPVIYSTGAAGDFAYGAVSLLDALGCVDELSFGCESPSLDALDEVTEFMLNHQEDLAKEIASFMKEGNSYPKARELALLNHFNEHIVEGLCKPNNILATEYRKALYNLGSNIKPCPIHRIGSNYYETELNMQSYSSATAIRECILSSYDYMNNDDSYVRNEDDVIGISNMSFVGNTPVRQAMSEPLSPIINHVPSSTYDILLERLGRSYPLTSQNFSREVGYKAILEKDEGYEQYLDVSRELSDKIKKNLAYFQSYDQFCSLLKTKEITYSRVSRCLTHILLDIKKDCYDKDKKASYARILGFRKDSEQLLSIVKESSSIPMITKLADAGNVLDERQMCLLDKDIMAAHIYDFVSACKYQSKENANEFTRQIVIV